MSGKFYTILPIKLILLSVFVLQLYSPSYAAQHRVIDSVFFSIFGVKDAALKNIQIRLANKLRNATANENTKQILRFYRTVPYEVKKALQPYGFFRAKVSTLLRRKNHRWQILIFVEQGMPLRITSISIKLTGPGASNAALRELISNFPIKTHDVFQVPAYNSAKTKLFQVAKNQGYIKARFKNKILIDRRFYTCRIEIKLETGQRYYFGQLIYKTHPYAECFMQRFMQFKVGDVFSSAKLLETQQALENTYYFRQAILRPDLENIQDYEIPIHAYLYPPPAIKYSLGLGYGTLTGFRLAGELSLRHLDNIGTHFEGQAKLSSVLSMVGAHYIFPGKNPLTDEWSIGANYKQFNPKTGKSDGVTFTGSYATKFEKLQMNMGLNFLYERFYVFRPYIYYAHMLYPRLQLTYINVDNPTTPHYGLLLSGYIQAAAQPILSTTSFAQSALRGKFLISPFNFARIIARGALGYSTIHRLPRFPLSLRFFAGGVNSIRGFADSSIGPGRYLNVGSIEYQQRVWGNVYAAIFYDIGTASNHFNKPINRGAGAGVVYDSPIGPIKLYLARALCKKGMPHSLEFSIGPEFS